MIKIFIIILHYGDIRFTLNCLKSLEKINKGNLDIKTIVVCNTLINQSGRRKLKNLSDFIIQNKKNLGFAEGNNIGIKKALRSGADYVLLLNNDTIIYKNFLLQLIKAAEEYLDVGIVGPTIRHKVKEKTFYDYGGIINWKLGKPYHINFKKRTRIHARSLRYARDDKKAGGTIERDFVSGCCMLIKKEVFEKIGFLNEKYFLYLEDVEFCVRAIKAGFTILLNPGSCIFHLGSGRSKSEIIKIFYSFRNALRFIWSHVPAKYKAIAFVYNMFFYPAIFLKWQITKWRKNIICKFTNYVF